MMEHKLGVSIKTKPEVKGEYHASIHQVTRNMTNDAVCSHPFPVTTL